MNDDTTKKLNEISERIARIETLLGNLETINHRLDRHSDRLKKLEENQSQMIGAKAMFVWIIVTLFAGSGAIPKILSHFIGG